MPFSIWLTFAGASLMLAVAPGPDNIFVLTQSAVHGARSGMIVVLGLLTGLVVQTFCAALGLAAVVAASPTLFWAIKAAGAAYLLYLAFMAWKHAVSGPGSGEGSSLTGWALWRRGCIMNITNPKVQIFFLAFFPQFVPKGTEGWDLVLQMVIQGLTFMAATAVVFGAVAYYAGTLADKMRSPTFQLILNRSSAVIFLGLAAYTLLG